MTGLCLRHQDQELLLRSEHTLGRHSACDLRLAHPMVSRHHARVGVGPQGAWIESLGSPGSTLLNGKPVDGRQPLAAGDRLDLGPCSVQVEAAPVSSDSQPAADVYAPLTNRLAGTGALQRGGAVAADLAAIAEPAARDEAAAPTHEDEDDAPLPAGAEASALLPVDAPPPPPDAAVIVYRGRSHVIAGTVIAGRGRQCGIVVADTKASRQHLRLRREGDGPVTAEDLSSANGTLVNGVPLTSQRRLAHGDRLTIGTSHLVLQMPQAAAPAAAAAARGSLDLVGRTIAGYRVSSLLGRGALAAVYRARQLNLDRDVALKVFLPDILDQAGFAERVLEQARIAGRVVDDGLAQLHEVGQDDGLVWYSMELVPGERLDRLVEREGPLAPQTALIIAERLARALAAAHRGGATRNEITPGNVMLMPSGAVKMLDVGMAAVLQEGRQSAERTAVVGNPAYMSPEQAQGQDTNLRSDLYSLGCLLCFMLTGRPPYLGATPEAVINQHLSAPIPALAERRPGLHAAVDTLMASLLAKNPAWRFADADELVAELGELRQALAAAPAPAPAPTPAPERPRNQRSSQVREVQELHRFRNGLLTLTVWGVAGIAALVLGVPVVKSLLREHPAPPAPVPAAGHASATAGAVPGGDAATRPPSANGDDGWRALAAANDELRTAARWGEAEFALEQALRAGGPLASRIEQRLVRVRLEGDDWFRIQVTQLAALDDRGRLDLLARLRDQVLRSNRADVEARYQEAIGRLHQRLADAGRTALLLIEQGRLADLPAAVAVPAEALRDTPAAPQAERLQRLATEAARAPWAGGLAATRERYRQAARLQPQELMPAAALLLLSGLVDEARPLLEDARLGDRGAARNLNRARSVLLDFSSPADAAFISVERGEVVLRDGALTGTAEEPSSLVLGTLSGPRWDLTLELRLDTTPSAPGTGLTISLMQDKATRLALLADPDGLTLRAIETGRTSTQVNALPQDGRLRLRIATADGRSKVHLGNQLLADNLRLGALGELTVALDAHAVAWRLQRLQITAAP